MLAIETAAALALVLPELLLLAATGPGRLWFVVPLITSVSLVYAATRHEEMGPIFVHAGRFAIWILIFMGIVLVVIQAMTWLV